MLELGNVLAVGHEESAGRVIGAGLEFLLKCCFHEACLSESSVEVGKHDDGYGSEQKRPCPNSATDGCL